VEIGCLFDCGNGPRTLKDQRAGLFQTRAWTLRKGKPAIPRVIHEAEDLSMVAEASPVSHLLPLLVYFGAIFAITAVMLGGAYLLGQRHRAPSVEEPFESGIVPTGDVHIRFSVQFYLIAIFFVIFDMETVFLFAWAITAKQAGWAGFIEALFFIAILVATLIYLNAIGALDWRTRRQRIEAARRYNPGERHALDPDPRRG
jgi:NADH-quinone oxidoreductase subunit A